ncbi:MAG: divergent polysaccharide deacetylase family protein [Deltaproteobacteria bacterium]|nr:divergent polysaccharide deacetylase family protein [Deltaproteobacteria bacterium]
MIQHLKTRPLYIYIIAASLFLSLVLSSLLYVSHHRSLKQAAIKRYTSETLIKGCLFELGIKRQDVHIDGNRISVYVPRKISIGKIFEVFNALRPLSSSYSIRDNHIISLVIQDIPWDIDLLLPKEKSLVAIIVDDMGLSMKAAKKLGSINAALTFSILPFRPYSREVAWYLHSRGKELILHLPMEGNGKNPGKGAIYTYMRPEDIRSILSNDLSQIPFISGVNNHMGSKVTQDKAIMSIVYEEINKKGLFFVDSLTTRDSVCKAVALKTGIPFASRDVFLDNKPTYKYISTQLRKLIFIGRYYRSAIGICHPHPMTIYVLKKEIPKLERQDVELVPVSTFIKMRGDHHSLSRR